jgi:hypothetical protein
MMQLLVRSKPVTVSADRVNNRTTTTTIRYEN